MPQLPPAFLDELRARTPIASVVGRKVRLARAGRNWKGYCCFHPDKTPSLTVYEATADNRAHFKCFGCGVSGDVIEFVMRDRGLDFREAVDVLAKEAGLDVPRDPEADASHRRREALREVLDCHAEVWRERLRGTSGRAALDYLHGRGITDEAIEAWGIGWSGDPSVLSLPPDDLRDAGLIGLNGGPLFRSRIMFPIHDERGRIVSFSGRAMGDGMPKYVNGPETALWSKGRTVFGLHMARNATTPPAFVEGQTDVVALWQAGIPAVAPLGTALTADQLAAVWRYHPAPVLALDGDEAGRKATLRAVTETALPLLTAERTLRIARLPDRHDPDTLLRVDGADAMRALLDDAQPFHTALYDALAVQGTDTPEARAALAKSLAEAAGRINDRSLAREYRQALRGRFDAETRPVRPELVRPSMEAFRAQFRNTAPMPEITDATPHQVRVLAAIALRHPALIPEIAERWASLDLLPDAARLREVVLGYAEGEDGPDPAEVMALAEAAGFPMADVLCDAPIPLPPCAQPDAPLQQASEGWWHVFALLSRKGLEAELEQAQDEAAETNTPEAWRRLVGLAKARVAAISGRNPG